MAAMLSPEIYLLIGIIGVFAASILYTNAIERATDVMGWGHSFAGSIISPVFTSAPELVVFVLAVFVLGGRTGYDIGLGTIVGEPFMASAFAVPVMFFAILLSGKIGKSERYVKVERELYLPFLFMVIFFPLLILPSYLHYAFEKYILGIGLSLAYIIYVYFMVKSRKTEYEEESEEEEVYLSRFLPEKPAILAQSVISLLILLPSSSLLVHAVSDISAEIEKSAFAISIVIVPIATLLPEMIAALIWAYRGKYTLAIGALIGEEVMYATIYPGLSLFVLPWVSGPFLAFSVLSTVAVSFLLLLFISSGKIHKYSMIAGLVLLAAYIVMI